VQSSDSLEQPTSPIVVDQSFPRSSALTHDGEQALAKKYGRHGDINPGNILWYDDSHNEVGTLKGTLKLADFGQAELNSLLSRTKPRSVANTMTYRPPECDLQPKIIRQSYDIWCLGCVYLEFITWLLGGEPLLLKFASKRMTADVFQNNQLTDTFFQIVRDQETHKARVMIKQAVTHVRFQSLLWPKHRLIYHQ
jgi:serine/threonine protein kinase